MRRYILGLALLLLLPLFSLPIAKQLACHHLLIADALSAASAAVQPEDAADFLEEAYALWQKKRNFTAAFVHHAPLETIECDFAALRFADQTALATGCARLEAQFRALAEAQQLNWWEFL